MTEKQIVEISITSLNLVIAYFESSTAAVNVIIFPKFLEAIQAMIGDPQGRQFKVEQEEIYF